MPVGSPTHAPHPRVPAGRRRTSACWDNGRALGGKPTSRLCPPTVTAQAAPRRAPAPGSSSCPAPQWHTRIGNNQVCRHSSQIHLHALFVHRGGASHPSDGQPTGRASMEQEGVVAVHRASPMGGLPGQMASRRSPPPAGHAASRAMLFSPRPAPPPPTF